MSGKSLEQRAEQASAIARSFGLMVGRPDYSSGNIHAFGNMEVVFGSYGEMVKQRDFGLPKPGSVICDGYKAEMYFFLVARNPK